MRGLRFERITPKTSGAVEEHGWPLALLIDDKPFEQIIAFDSAKELQTWAERITKQLVPVIALIVNVY